MNNMNSTEKKAETGPKRSELRRFGSALALMLMILAALQLWRGGHLAVVIAASLGLLFLILALFLPAAVFPVYWSAVRAGRILGWINTKLILAIIYYGMFTPVALVMKLIKRDPLKRGFKFEAETYWIEKAEETNATKQYEKMF